MLMKYQEKKYLVDSFTHIQNLLKNAGSLPEPEVITTHYYARHPSKDVVKLVQFADKNEIHLLRESRGKFILTQRFPVPTKEAGLHWLKQKGYRTVSLVKMADTDYAYRNGIVGLYILNDEIRSVILDFPDGEHETIAKELELDSARAIDVPYNTLLEQMGKLHSIPM